MRRLGLLVLTLLVLPLAAAGLGGHVHGASAELRIMPAISIAGAKQALLRPKADFYFGSGDYVYANVACVDSPEYMVDEPYGVEVILTTNGSVPTVDSRHYGFVWPHGCTSSAIPPPATVSSPARCVFVKVSLGGGIFFRVAGRTGGRTGCKVAAPRLVRTLFVVSSGQTVVGAMRVRFFHTHVRFISSAFDRGPCPVRCWHG